MGLDFCSLNIADSVYRNVENISKPLLCEEIISPKSAPLPRTFCLVTEHV